MKEDQARELIEAAADEAAQDRAARTFLEDGRTTPRILVNLWQGTDHDRSERAFAILLDLEEQAVVPLVERSGTLDPTDRVQAIRAAAVAEQELRQRIVAELNAMLGDHRPVPEKPRLGPMEVTPRRRRVCDEAYLLMREVVHFGEDEIDRSVAADAFLNLPEEKRDAAIARARSTDTWNRLVLGDEDESEGGEAAPRQ